MSRQSLLMFILVTSVVVVTLHFTAMSLYLYWSVFWFDMVVHFLGGFLMALIGVWILFLSHYLPFRISFNGRNVLLCAFFFVLIVGIGWEIFEFVLGFVDKHNYIADTSTDLIMNELGAIGAYIIVVHSRWCSMLE